MTRSKILAALLAASALATASPALSRSQPYIAYVMPDDPGSGGGAGEDDPVALRSQVSSLEVRLAEANARADALEARFAQLEARLGLPEGDDSMASIRGKAMPELRGRRIGDTVIAERDFGGYDLAPIMRTGARGLSGAARLQDTEPDRKSAAPTAAVEDITRKEQGYFGTRFTLEPGLTYTHFDNARINLNGFLALDSIFLGRISIDDVSADIGTIDMTGRYSFSPRFQVDANVPYLIRRSHFASGGAGGNSEGVSEATRTARGLGDVSFGASYRLLQERAGTPDVVLNARVKAPTGRHPFGVELQEIEGSQGNLAVPTQLSTGSGVWGASVGLSALKTIDPMVVYGSVSYFHNFQRHFGDIDEAVGDQPGSARLGRAIQFGAGVAFALNDRSSLNFGYTQRLVSHTRVRRDGQDWTKVASSGANVALMNIGATFSLSEHTTLITNVGIGLTADAPNMIVSMRIPFRF